MARVVRSALLACLFLAAGAGAQAPSSPPRAGAELKRLCDTIAMTPADAREAARRAECVLAGVLPSPNRFDEARTLARWALSKGEPAGGLMLYLVFQNDPANQAVREGRVDPQAYRKLAARSVAQRGEQVEAIEGLGFAVGQGHPAAGALLAAYFHDTLAPRNVARLGALSGLLLRGGERSDVIERFAREADTIARSAPGTKASVRAFVGAWRDAIAAARQGYGELTGGRSCEQEKVQLQSVSAGDIEGAEFLPLTGKLVADSYLVRGRWTEAWTFQACEQKVPVRVTFEADGWGGATSTAAYHKGV
jgi:hypothetical protein